MAHIVLIPCSTLAILLSNSIGRYGEFPKWNPFALTGLPHSGDPLTEVFNPISALSYLIFGPVRGLRAAALIAFFLAGLGQLILGYVLGFRFPVRVWSAILLMLSGGIAMLWRAGWYGYLFGVVWFPFCIAFVLWALASRKKLPIALSAISNAMLFLSGSLYWSFYLFGTLLFITIFVLVVNQLSGPFWGKNRTVIIKMGAISVLTLGLISILLLPMTDSYANMGREVLPDIEQRGAQTIPHALINYVIADFDWFMSSLLDKAASGTWFYIGATPMILLALVPLAYTQSRQRSLVLLIGGLFLLLLAWQANPTSPIGYIYKQFPILYSFRFPQRLLIVAVTPLLALAGVGANYIFEQVHKLKLDVGIIPIQAEKEKRNVKSVSLSTVLEVALVVLLALSIRDVYRENQPFAFSEGEMYTEPEDAMSWLNEYDPGMYYIDIGNGPIIWHWIPAAYQNEHKVINFQYGRLLNSWSHQRNPESPIRATPKYIFVRASETIEPPASLLRSFEGVDLYQTPDSLPYAFTLSEELVNDNVKLAPSLVQAAASRLDGPNRIIVEASSTQPGELLIVLESYYPGWKVYVDDQEQPVEEAGGFMAVEVQTGPHTYTFSFEPVKFTWGWIISLFTLIVVILLILSDRYQWIAEIPAKLIARISSLKPDKNE